MANHTLAVGAGAANAPGQDERRTDDRHVAELSEDSYDRDLRDTDLAVGHEARAYTAYDAKELHAAMPDFTNEELRRIPILAHGERLDQGALYIDLHHREGGPFTARAGQESQDPHRYVAKALVDYTLWNKLAGIRR